MLIVVLSRPVRRTNLERKLGVRTDRTKNLPDLWLTLE
jgi:hypothetical protein